jgi:hypothetical protein
MTARNLLHRSTAVLGAALLVAACASGEAEPEASPTPAVSAPAPAPVAAIDATMLLPASEMPPWNDAIAWQETAVADLVVASPACMLPTPESLGAAQHFTATYSADGTMSGSNTIMLFPDEATAQAALAAYEAAMPQCLNQEGDRGLITDDQAASSWTGALECAVDGCGENDGLFEFIGVGAQDNTAALVSFNLIAQDANYCNDPEICPDPRDPVLPEVYASLERMSVS